MRSWWARILGRGAGPTEVEPPLISVVVPHRDDPDALSLTVRSVLEDNCRSAEVLIVDDASPPDGLGLLEAQASNEPRLRVIRHAEPKGLSMAAAHGLAEARGALVMFLEPGDGLARGALEHCVGTLTARGWRPGGDALLGGAWVRCDLPGAPPDADAATPDAIFAEIGRFPLGAWRAPIFDAARARRVGGLAGDRGDENVVEDLVYRLLRHAFPLIGVRGSSVRLGSWTERDEHERGERQRTFVSRAHHRMREWEIAEGLEGAFIEPLPYPTGPCVREADRPDVLFMPHNGYHTREMAGVARELERRGRSTLFVDITRAYRDEGVGAALRELEVEGVAYEPDVLRRLRPGVLFVMNDWGTVVHDRVLEARQLGVTSIALVEGVQDYEDTHVDHLGAGHRRGAYRLADLVLLVGDYDRKFFPAERVCVTGSTRIEALAREPRATQRARRVVINSNFTYGIYTDAQPAWIESAVEACRRAGVEYVISQHHADRMGLGAHTVSDRSLYDELRECGVFVSRFSGAILEAMALGAPVIYHNPHAERVDKFLDPAGAFPITTDAVSLAEAIERTLTASSGEVIARQRSFFAGHVSIDDARPSHVRIADEIESRLRSTKALRG